MNREQMKRKDTISLLEVFKDLKEEILFRQTKYISEFEMLKHKGKKEKCMKMVDKIIELYGVDLRERSRLRKYTYPRMACVYILHVDYKFTFSQIAYAFGNYNHSTMINSRDNVLNFLNYPESDPLFQDYYIDILRIISIIVNEYEL